MLDAGYDKFLMLGEGGHAAYADPNPKIEEMLAVLDRVIGVMYEVGSVPVAAVQPQQSHAESAVSRQIQFMPLRDIVKELQTQDLESERELIAKSLLLHRMHTEGGGTYEQVLDDLDRLEIQYPEHYHAIDEQARVQLYMARREARLESRRMQLRREHPEMDEPAIEALIEQIDHEH
jgi:hypothetical protein